MSGTGNSLCRDCYAIHRTVILHAASLSAIALPDAPCDVRDLDPVLCLARSALRNQRQENSNSVQIVPGMRLLVFDFGVKQACPSARASSPSISPGTLSFLAGRTPPHTPTTHSQNTHTKHAHETRTRFFFFAVQGSSTSVQFVPGMI
eukprot:3729688-Rhodomonas_salina.2